jgi:hypothetical protein
MVITNVAYFVPAGGNTQKGLFFDVFFTIDFELIRIETRRCFTLEQNENLPGTNGVEETLD